MLLLAQEEEVLAQLILGERERIAAEMFGELAHVTDVFLFGGRAVIFEFDKLLELCDGGMGMMKSGCHRPARMPSREDKIARPLSAPPGRQKTLDLPRRAAAQFNQSAAANRRPAGQSDGSGNLSATVAADRAFPAAVAELGR